MKKFWALFHARNLEFLRDKSALSWNFIFPFLIIFSFSFIFDRDTSADMFKLSLVTPVNQEVEAKIEALPFIKIIKDDSLQNSLDKLNHHRVDLVLDTSKSPFTYWVSETSPNSQLSERILLQEFAETKTRNSSLQRNSVKGSEVPYLDWLFPGVLGMNIMFSALFGVGYTVVRYRKNGVLKRLSITPLSAFEYLSAQILSRMYLITLTTLILYIGCKFMFNFQCKGSYLTLFLIFFLGSVSMCAMSLLIATRTSSEELAGGLLNLLSWPMMILSEVWFSLEGSPVFIQKLSLAFPLTHMVVASRKIMNDGAGLDEVGINLLVLILMGIVFLSLGSAFFKWEKDISKLH